MKKKSDPLWIKDKDIPDLETEYTTHDDTGMIGLILWLGTKKETLAEKRAWQIIEILNSDDSELVEAKG